MLTQKKDYGHYLFLLCIAGALFINFYFSNDILSLAVTVLCCFYLLIVKREYYVPTAIFFTAYSYLFRYGNYGIFIFVCLFVLLRGLMFQMKHMVSFLTVIIVYAFTHLLSTFLNSMETSIGDYIPLFSILCLLTVCMNYKPENKSACIQHFLFAFFTSSILGFWVGETRLGEILTANFLSDDSWQDTVRFSGLSYDCNFYALSAILALYFSLFEDKFIFSRKNTFLRYIVLGAVAILGMLTYSKMFMLASIGLLGLAAVFSDRKTKKRLLFLVPVIVLMVVLFSESLINWINIMQERLGSSGDLNELTTGRSDLWERYIEKIFSSPSSFMMGQGILGLEGGAAHNTYLEIMSKFGLLGVIGEILLLYMANQMLPHIEKTNKKNFAICLIVQMALLFTLSAYTFYGLWVIIFFVLISKQGLLGSGDQDDQRDNPSLQRKAIYRRLY